MAVFAFFVFADLNAMTTDKGYQRNETNIVQYIPKQVRTIKYNVEKLNISILQVKEWKIFDFKDNTNQHKIFYNALSFPSKNYDGKKQSVRSYIKIDMDQSSIKKILEDMYPNQQIKTTPCCITFFEYQ